MAGLGDAFMMSNPEVGVSMEVGKQLAPHAPALAMVPFISFAVILIIVGIIMVAAAANKTSGVLLTLLGVLLGGGAFFVMVRSEMALQSRSAKSS